MGENYDGGKNLITVKPYYEDKDVTFWPFMQRCGVEFLSQFPVVVEHLFADTRAISQKRGIWGSGVRLETRDLLGEAFIAEYQKRGGRLCSPGRNVLLALSEYGGPKVLPLIPPNGILVDGIVEYHAYGLCKEEDGKRDIHLYCQECHDHILIETSDDPQIYIDRVQKLCDQEGRELVIVKNLRP